MKFTVTYRYIEDDMTPVMYFPTQRMGLDFNGVVSDYNIKKAIADKLNSLNMDIDKIRNLEYWEDTQ